MPNQKSEKIKCAYFIWVLRNRGGVWQADGRTNNPSPGRHSLNTRDYEEALQSLHKLDLVKAVELGLADPAALNSSGEKSLELTEGVRLYLEHCGRPAVLGGIKPKSVTRYRAAFDKFTPYMKKKGFTCWEQIKRKQLESYAAWLDGEGYAYGTELFEITAIKSAFNWWIGEGLLSETSRIILPMEKAEDTDTYCYRPEEVLAMLELCRDRDSLHWLANVILALAYTGMRISELANLGPSNVDLERNMLILRDESRTKRAKKPNAKTTKSKRFRCFPIHSELRVVLERLLSGNNRARVFTALRGGILRPDNVRWVLIKQVIEPLVKSFPSHEDEIGFKDGRLHSLRHFFCSFCAHSQVPEQVVMRWLGHRDSKMVRRYYHLHDEEAQRQMMKLKSLGDSGALERLPNVLTEDPEVTG